MKMLFSSLRVNLLAGSVLGLVLFSACNKLDNEDAPDVPVSGLMAFNLAPDISQATITLSGNSLTATPLPYTNYTGGYLGVYSGERSVQSYNYGTGSSLASGSYTFEPDNYYSLFVIGANNTYRNVIVNDELDSLSTASGEAFVRYINAIPDSSQPTVTITAGGSNVVNTPAAYASVSDFVAVSPGDISITVSNGSTIDTNRTLTLEQRKVYTILLTGVPGGSGGSEVQIKFIQNGTVDASAGRSASASARSTN